MRILDVKMQTKKKPFFCQGNRSTAESEAILRTWFSGAVNLLIFSFYVEKIRCNDVFFLIFVLFWLLIVLLQLFSQAKSPLLDPMSHGRFFRPVPLGSFIIFIGQFVHLLPFYFTLNAVILAGQHDAEMILRSALLKSMVTAGASRCWRKLCWLKFDVLL